MRCAWHVGVRGPARVAMLGLVAAAVVAATGAPTAAHAAAQAATPHVATLQPQPTLYSDWGVGSAMGYDADTGQLILSGGQTASSVCGCDGTGGTWVWNGSDFALVVPPGSATIYSSLVYDGMTHQMLRVGGDLADGSTPVGTTSLWTGSAWQTLAPAHQPSPRQGDVSAYDARTGQLILFGGVDAAGLSAQTWTWTGTDWKLLSPPTSPSARNLQTMAYDDATGQLVLYGGRSQAGFVGDTWTWTGSTWKARAPVHSPGPLVSAAMSYDPALHALVLFGGRPAAGVSSGASWKWTGSDWVPLPGASGPTDVNWPSMAWDPTRSQLVLLAPLSDKPAGVAHDLFLVAAPTQTSLTVSGGTSGLPVLLAASVLAKQTPAPGGTAAFTRDGQPVPGCSAVPVVAGAADCTTAVLAGSHTFRAVYSGLAGYLGSQSAKVAATLA